MKPLPKPALVRERPILFSAPMVKAILAGTKTQTRRILKSPNVVDLDVFAFDAARGEWEGGIAGEGGVFAHGEYVRCPYGVAGDRLWVKETHKVYEAYDFRPREVFYRSDFSESTDGTPWKPSIFMRRRDSRIDLEITKVRVERLQEITEADAKAEGVKRDPSPCDHSRYSCEEINCLGPTHKATFADLWDAINGERASWASNPWVWVVEFRRIRP